MLRAQTSAPGAPYTSPYRREVKTISQVVLRKLRLEIAVLAGGFGPSTRDGAACIETAPPQLFPPPDNVVTLHPAMHWRRGWQSPVRAKPARRGASVARLCRKSRWDGRLARLRDRDARPRRPCHRKPRVFRRSLVQAGDLLEVAAIQSSDKIPDNASYWGVDSEFSTFAVPHWENPWLAARKCCVSKALQPKDLRSSVSPGTGR